MSIANRRRISARLFTLWKGIAGKDVMINPEPGDKAIGAPGLTIGQALSLWVEYMITPKQEVPDRTQYDYLLQAVVAMQEQQFNLTQWCGEAVKIGLEEAEPDDRRAAVRKLVPPSIRMMSVIRYNLAVMLAVLYAAQATQIDPKADPDAADDLYKVLRELETLRASTRPLENQLGIIFRVPQPVREPHFPAFID